MRTVLTRIMTALLLVVGVALTARAQITGDIWMGALGGLDLALCTCHLAFRTCQR